MNFINAMAALNMINEGGADYQKEYKDYIIAHKEKVEKFADWLLENCPSLFDEVDPDIFWDLIKAHDYSKFSEDDQEKNLSEATKEIIEDILIKINSAAGIN